MDEAVEIRVDDSEAKELKPCTSTTLTLCCHRPAIQQIVTNGTAVPRADNFETQELTPHGVSALFLSVICPVRLRPSSRCMQHWLIPARVEL
jgi:hypothetical protein